MIAGKRITKEEAEKVIKGLKGKVFPRVERDPENTRKDGCSVTAVCPVSRKGIRYDGTIMGWTMTLNDLDTTRNFLREYAEWLKAHQPYSRKGISHD